jgi:TolB protein
LADNVDMRFTALAAASAALLALLLSASGSGAVAPRIVFRTVHLATPRRPPELWSVLPSGAGRRLLARGADQPEWSPDRRRIAYAGGGILGREGIWVMNADGTGKRRLTRVAGDGNPTWSPDGRRIMFRRSALASFDLWIVPAAGGIERPFLTTPVANELDPDWSPDGNRIAFQSSRGGSIQIWVLDVRTKQARRLTSGPPSFSPDWSPDGRRIAFSSRGRICVVNADGRDRRTLPSGSPNSADDPAWSPTGTRIAFQRGGQVLSMRSGGGDLRYVTRALWGTNGEPDW